MTVTRCIFCGHAVPPRRRKYCADCAAEARRVWKRQQRRVNHGSPYWLDHWIKRTADLHAAREAYNAYMRAYMRRYRQRSKRGPTASEGNRDALLSERLAA